MNIKHLFIFTFIIVTFNACSNTSNNMPIQSASLLNTMMQLNEKNNKLFKFYSQWKGVKYKYGGTSKKGIDCSAFIQKAYNTTYNIKIPRTTKYQSRIGREISKNQLQTGDLVFFKTGYNTRHVGIYTNNGKFMHASTKKGVIISTLENVYYKKHYWKSVRVFY